MSVKVRRALVPVAVIAGLAVVGTAVYPALASEGGPKLPDTTAEELIVRVVESETDQLTGTVKVNADFGMPDISGLLKGVDGPVAALAGLASGENTLQVAMDGPDRQRLVLANGADEFSVIHNGDSLWLYDGAGNTSYRVEVPEADAAAYDAATRPGGLTPQDAAERLLDKAGEHADVSVDGTAQVAGRSTYQLVVVPQEAEGQVESARISVDAETGVPLAVTLSGADKTVLDVAFTQVDYQQPSSGTFDFTPPQGSSVLEIDPENPAADLPGIPGLSGLPDLSGLDAGSFSDLVHRS